MTTVIKNNNRLIGKWMRTLQITKTAKVKNLKKPPYLKKIVLMHAYQL